MSDKMTYHLFHYEKNTILIFLLIFFLWVLEQDNFKSLSSVKKQH